MKKKQVIRLTESDLHRIIKESVKRVLRESKYDSYNAAPYDEYNEFDRNIDDEMEGDYYKTRLRFMDGDYSKKVIDKLIEGIYEGDAEAYDAYEYAKRNGICPQFVKQVENNLSWREIGPMPNKEDKTLGYDYDGKTRLKSGLRNAAMRGLYPDSTPYDERERESLENNYGRGPLNDKNLNVYDLKGKFGMDAQLPLNYDEEGTALAARLARPTIRSTYNAGRNFQKNRK